jgi:hypothetical protein
MWNMYLSVYQLFPLDFLSDYRLTPVATIVTARLFSQTRCSEDSLQGVR